MPYSHKPDRRHLSNYAIARHVDSGNSKARKGSPGQLAFSLPRTLDLTKFRAAWRSVVRSQPILRTHIIQTPLGTFLVVVNEPMKWRKASSLKDYLRKDKEVSMQYGGRLQRFCIVEDKITAERYFVWSVHHSCYDGWVLGLLFKELESTYHRGFTTENPVKVNQLIKYSNDRNKTAAGNFFSSHLAGAVTKPLLRCSLSRILVNLSTPRRR